jgi:hypothetical protein
MIIYCAANKKYFDLYFDLWADQLQKYYPEERKVIALYQGTPDDVAHANSKGVEVKDITNDERFPSNPIIKHFYLLRWMHLPYEYGVNILETQVNCLAIKRQQINSDNWGVDHARISRWKVKKGGAFKGGISAAVFTPEAAKQVTEQATLMVKNPPDSDHEINVWQEQNLSFVSIIAEQQFKQLNKRLTEETCWVTAGTSQHYTAEEKIKVLKHYINE